MSNVQTRSFRREQREMRRRERQTRLRKQASEKTMQDKERLDLINEIRPLTAAVLAKLSTRNWKSAREINRRGGPHVLWSRKIPAHKLGAIGYYPEGGEPVATYIATNGKFYQWDNWYCYRPMALEKVAIWQLEELRTLLKRALP